ncbi:ShlB/FhaC/HecB family hemolysin secretion/activation protein [Microbulbifer aestuariivivens]|uniref:ShlB/FhaC/HecB family hemolysin secretion/activation protein n=1 Tax=Microbulbifer aestuariivivens TaxID=1908308 RepID=UPI0031EED5F6
MDIIPGADAGAQAAEALRREERLRARASQELEASTGEVEAVEVEETKPGPAFLLRSVRFSKSELLSEQQLRNIVTPYLGREVAHAQLMEIVEKVNRTYRQEGVYTAVAVLPQQEIRDGVVIIRLIEGRLGKIRFEGNQYTSDAFFESWLSGHEGRETVDMPLLQADILAFNRVHDARVQAELRRGESFGLTDIVIKIQEPERGYFQGFTDNYGYESSGREELGFMYRHQHLLDDGDRAIAYLSASEGAQSLSLGYNRPLGQSRWRAGVSGSLTRTDLKEGDFATSDVNGDSYRIGMESSWLAWSGERMWLDMVGALGYTRSTTEIAGVVFSDDAIVRAELGASFTWIGSRWQVSGRQTAAFSDLDDKSDVGSAQQASSEVLFNGGLSGYYRFGASGFYSLAAAEWQYSDAEALPGSLSFTLGGPASVRAYLPSAVSGDSGWYGQVEAHYDAWQLLGVAVDAFAFYDYGEAESLNPSQTLAAAGLGLSLTERVWSLELTVAAAMRDVLPTQDDEVLFARFSYRY